MNLEGALGNVEAPGALFSGDHHSVKCPGAPPRVAGVLLAAGLSSRMGQPKPLALLGGEPLCRYAARALAGATGYAALLAVIPAGTVGADIRDALVNLATDLPASLSFEFVVNPAPERGMLSSFQVALAALSADLPDQLGGANFALADMPRLTSAVHTTLLDAFARSRAPLVLAAYGGAPDAVRAPPHLFRADLWPEIMRLPASDHGPRTLVKKYAAQAQVLHFAPQLLLDVDTPQALAEAQQSFGAGKGNKPR